MLEERLTNYIEGMTISEQFSIFREYCECIGYYDDCPEYTENIDDYYYGMKPTEIIRRYGDVNLDWDYYYIDGYGDACEWDGIETNSSIEEVVDYIINNDNDLGNADIRDILEEEVEEEEEEDF